MIDNLPPLPQPEFDNLLDHIYEYGTLAEGTIPRARALCEAYARAAILAERERWKEEIEAQEEKYFVLASELVYNGNSVQHWCSKAKAYGDAIMQCWDVLKEAGRPPDGKTQLHEAIAAAIRENS